MVLSKFECEGHEHNVSSCERTHMDSHKECESMRAAEVRCERGPFVMDAPEPVAVSIENVTTQDTPVVICCVVVLGLIGACIHS